MISPADLAVLAFAGYRGTQLLVHDTILDPARDRVYAWHERRPDGPVRDFVITLISCIYCTGWWVAGAVLLTWLLVTGTWGQVPVLVHVVEWLAVAGAAALLNRWDDSRKDGA